MTSDTSVTYTLSQTKLETSDEARAELEILRALAAGKNPLTGALLPDDSCYQSAKILRALLSAVKALENLARQSGLPQKAGQPWSAEEDVELGKCFEQGMKIADLARKHTRTEGAIRSRLEKLGKIAPQYGASVPSAPKTDPWKRA